MKLYDIFGIDQHIWNLNADASNSLRLYLQTTPCQQISAMSTTEQQLAGQQGQDQESSEEDIPRTPRRTPMACQFCRGRKLKCDGLKPSCSNCNRRSLPCQYVPV
ncbi:hypothetical protein BDY19DRAFT_195083 [Irpex rosettiformis]|uniref:Uncharacterized protein n=1 Tax=Irpex rosettiformis TaxID=378272 RepID=A0ACB8U1Z5_9APHY|nr:hypothetical protein BDY19DRAFT_195083 [Irpex rosettiformis]